MIWYYSVWLKKYLVWRVIYIEQHVKLHRCPHSWPFFYPYFNGCCRVTNSLYRKMMSLFFNPTSKTLISSVLISAGETEHQRWVEPAQRCFTRRRCATLYVLETQPRKVLTWSKGCNILDAPQLVTHFITATQKVPLKPWCSGICKTFYLAKVTV